MRARTRKPRALLCAAPPGSPGSPLTAANRKVDSRIGEAAASRPRFSDAGVALPYVEDESRRDRRRGPPGTGSTDVFATVRSEDHQVRPLPWQATDEHVPVAPDGLNTNPPCRSTWQFTCFDGSEMVVELLAVAPWHVAQV